MRRADDYNESLGWEGAFLATCIALVALLAILTAPGCTRATQLDTLAAVTSATSAAVPSMIEARERQGEKCFAGTPTKAEASACLDAVRAEWAPVWLALDTLEELDRAALAGSVDLAAAVSVYCGLAEVVASHGVALPKEVCP